MHSPATLLLVALPLLGLCHAVPAQKRNASDDCRCFPGDDCWPADYQWQLLNATVGGRLIASVPIAAVCHNSAYGPYDAEKCADLQNNWYFPQTHLPSSSSIMAPYWTNNSCNPFLDPDTPCTLGNYVSYAINATCAADFVAAIDFVRLHNIRLNIKNTGHDYIGKSTGAGALSIWTHYMNDMEILDYYSPHYTGKALKMGAGVMVQDSYKFTHDHGLVNVGGNCPTVGVAGGYSQGGGHGPLGSQVGLGADQALEWEVVTGTGQVLIATPEQNQDLYWALSGGGGASYGVVSSLTVKAYPDLQTTSANLTFSPVGVDPDVFWDIVETWLGSIPSFTDNGCYAAFLVTPEVFALEPATCYRTSKDTMMGYINPTLDKLKQNNVSYTFTITEFDNFYDSYVAYNSPWNVSNSQLGGRLVPKTLVENNLSGLSGVFRSSVEDKGLVATGVALNVSQAVIPPGGNAVSPVWRTAVFDFVIGVNYDYSNYTENIVLADAMTSDYLPPIESLTPGGGSYMNEANWQQPDFQEVFYGGNWDRLLQIKDKYDPDQIFYALTAVGSDRWYEDQSQGGRLCSVSSGSKKWSPWW